MVKGDNMKLKKRYLYSIIEMIVVIVVTICVFKFVVIPVRIDGTSMENTLHDQSIALINGIGIKAENIKRFDIIVLYSEALDEKIIKRVIGLPGETVEVKDGKVYIDGSEKPLDDSFCNEVPIGDFGPYEVPKNCYFMMGDNRNNSLDSRYWKNHFVEKDAILAKAVFRYWPFSEIGKVE